MSPRSVWLARSAAFVALLITFFRFPEYPALDLDASWAMALDWFSRDRLQFGRDIVFTYGPLGFLFANTYVGVHFWLFVLFQLAIGATFALIIIASAERLPPLRRAIFFAFFVLLSELSFEALYLMVVTMLGLELVRRTAGPWRPTSALICLLLAILGHIKFTILMLSTVAISASCGLALVLGHRRMAALLALWFVGGSLSVWLAMGQSPWALPSHLYGSWQLTQGYGQAMGLPTPPGPLSWGLLVAFALLSYLLVRLAIEFSSLRNWVRTGLLAIFVGLVWKQAFARGGGNPPGFFVAALLPVVGFPALLEDPSRRRSIGQLTLAVAGLLGLVGLSSAGLGYPTDIVGGYGERLLLKLDALRQGTSLRGEYEARLEDRIRAADLPRTREVVGDSSLDVLGFQQSVALLNRFNYRPRPVFQSYAAYNAYLAALNDAYYSSARAPEFVLFKLQPIDARLPALEDSLILRSLPYRYAYLHSERGFQLWKRRERALSNGGAPARLLRSDVLRFNEPFVLGELGRRSVWAQIQISPTLRGRLRSLVYKPPIVRLVVEGRKGSRTTHRLTPPQAETGFILNPLLLEDWDYLCFATGVARRTARVITLRVPDGDEGAFAMDATIKLFALPPPPIGQNEVNCDDPRTIFGLFDSQPERFRAARPPAVVRIEDREAVIMHAPSELEFALGQRPMAVGGFLGFVRGAYAGAGRTDGADFVVLWRNGSTDRELFRRRLDPLRTAADRGLQAFHVGLEGLSGGRLILRVEPGPTSDWDRTAWASIAIE